MKELFDKPKLIGLIGNPNSGKSNLIYHIIEELRQDSDFNLVTFGLKSVIKNSKQIWSLEELEQVTNSLIVIDETFSLFDMDNRTKKKQIEATFRLLFHNNNILIMSLLPENSKKFISSKLDAMIFKKCSMADFINGSAAKRIATNYRGPEKGTTLLDIKVDKALIFDGTYSVIDVPYLPVHDSKKGNQQIIKDKPVFFKKKTA